MRPRTAALTVAFCLALGCAQGPLSGSVSELFDLTVSAEFVQRNTEAFQLTYVHNQATAVDIVVSVGLSLTNADFFPGATVPLEGEYAPGHPRCVVVHHANGEPERALPPILKGTLHLGGGANPGDSTSGDFSMAFVEDGGYGSGRTLLGSFGGTVIDAGF